MSIRRIDPRRSKRCGGKSYIFRTVVTLQHSSEPDGRAVACTAANPELADIPACERSIQTSPTQTVSSRKKLSNLASLLCFRIPARRPGHPSVGLSHTTNNMYLKFK